MSKAIIVYWTGSGNTEIMAEKIKDGIDSCGYDVKMCMVDEIESEELLTYNNIIFGCPSMGEEILEETEFEPFFSEIEKNIENKNIALFGSYGWGDGEWMKTWEE
jgi:flavodoxin I